MKILKIYSTFATIAIITLFVILYQSNTKLTNSEKKVEQKETVLQQKIKLLKETQEVLWICK